MLQESHWTKCESPFCHNVITTRMLVSEKSVNFRANYLVRCQWQDILWCEHLWLNVMANSHQDYCLLLSTEYYVACWTTCLSWVQAWEAFIARFLLIELHECATFVLNISSYTAKTSWSFQPQSDCHGYTQVEGTVAMISFLRNGRLFA